MAAIQRGSERAIVRVSCRLSRREVDGVALAGIQWWKTGFEIGAGILGLVLVAVDATDSALAMM